VITAYFAERFRASFYLPLAVVIAIGSAAGHYGAAGLALDILAALLLLVEFRLWDDLADRQVDAVHHPERVLVNSSSLPFIALCTVLAIVNLTAAALRPGATLSVSLLACLHAVLAAWYWRRTRRTIAGDQLLLTKYPAFVVAIAGERAAVAPVTIAVAAIVLYAVASLYEAWHDPVSPLATMLGGRS